MTISVANAMLASAARYYYRAYGEFPATWQDLRQSGLQDAPLVGFQMQAIDPGDASLDFPGDVYFENRDGAGILHSMELNGEASEILLGIPQSYAEQFSKLSEMLPMTEVQARRFREYAADEKQLLQFAMLGSISRSLMIYPDVHGSAPATLDEYMNSGLCPITPSTINPVTGVPFRFDGSPGDITFRITEHGVGFRHVDAEGVDMPWFMYL